MKEVLVLTLPGHCIFGLRINESVRHKDLGCLVGLCVNNFNNISVILWRSVLLVDETGGPGENHRPVASHR
jgi:hypothetical protein